jgi:flagellin
MRNLSSGKRINRAADDAAGSQIAESFTTQVKGSTRAARNAFDGMSLAQTSEATLGSIANILHKMKELAVNAATDTLTTADRKTLQAGAQALTDEIESIGTQSNFASLSTLDGSFLDRAIHIGPNYGDAPRISIADARAQYLGRYAVRHTNAMSDEGLETGDLMVNDIRVRATVAVDDRVSSTQARSSAIAKAEAINDASNLSNVTAMVEQNEYHGPGEMLGGTLDSSNSLVINGEVINGFTARIHDADEGIRDMINQASKKTGVVASIDRKGRLQLMAEDGRNIHIKTTGNAHEITGLRTSAGDTVSRGTLTLVSEDLFRITDPSQGGAESKIGVVTNEIVGPNELNVISTIDISTRTGANRALVILDHAQEAVIQSRGKLAGLENRLEFTVSRLNEMAKNSYIARGKVVDADFAKEAADLAKNNIVQTAFSNVLAQANQDSFRVLQLL